MPSFFGRLNPNGRMVVVGAVAGQPPAEQAASTHRTMDAGEVSGRIVLTP